MTNDSDEIKEENDSDSDSDKEPESLDENNPDDGEYYDTNE
ncbi:MAG: hypothetical protein AAB693_02155 [Patescibacteria group bacterium]